MALSPYSSLGCGRSLKWEVVAVDIARELEEDCPHLDVFNVKFIIVATDELKKRNIKCVVSCPNCNAEFSKTNEKLTESYNKFYGKY